MGESIDDNDDELKKNSNKHKVSTRAQVYFLNMVWSMGKHKHPKVLKDR